MRIRKALLNPNLTNILTSLHIFKLINCRIKFRKGGGAQSGISVGGFIDEENSDTPAKYRRHYLTEEEVTFINSGGASKFDVIPKKDGKGKGKGKGAPAAKK